eukprot:m.170433 g.170433  ORF g.170433 m.170433 type:complete len:518 (+) comp13240_c0_seq1:81-1634(+)
MRAVLTTTLGVLWASTVLAEKIIWVPYPGAPSHHMLAVKTSRELAKRGHDVHIVNADFPGDSESSMYHRVDHRDVHFIPYKHPLSRDEFNAYWAGMATLDPFTGGATLAQGDANACDAMLSNTEVMAQLADADVIVVDAASRCGSIARDVLKTKIRVDFFPVTFSDPFFVPRLGSESPLHSIPQLGSRLSSVTTFGDRVHNTIVYLVDKLIETFIADKITEELRAKYNLTGTHAEAMSDTGMFIMQTSWGIEYPTALPPAVKLVGPILPSAGAPLPDDLNAHVSAMDDSEWGTLIVSFGTSAILSQERIDTVGDALALLKGKMNVVWKTTTMPRRDMPKHVKIVDWFPQNDLLAHDRVVAFLSHGGLNSVSEAAYHGVPVIGLPLFADQWDNLARLEYRGMATVVDETAFTAESLAHSIEATVTSTAMKLNAQRVSTIVRDTPKPPVELAADWIEYTIRQDGALFHKVPWPVHIPWYVARGYDVFFVLAILPSVIVWLACRQCCGSARTHTPKPKKE